MDQTAIPSPISPGIAEPGRSWRVLLVEDHEDTITYLSRHLESSGHVVSIARTARQAVAVAHSWMPDILLCDITLPDGDGCELLGHLREVRPTLCIAMSGFGMSQDINRSRAAGFDHHLTKPFLPDDLDVLMGSV